MSVQEQNNLEMDNVKFELDNIEDDIGKDDIDKDYLDKDDIDKDELDKDDEEEDDEIDENDEDDEEDDEVDEIDENGEDSSTQIDKLQNTVKGSVSTKNLLSAETSTIIGESQFVDDPDDQLESDGDDDYNEDIFKKLENGFSDDISFVHPQTTEVNNNELKNLMKVVRNKYGIIIDTIHRTPPILSKYEYTRILGQRLTQLNNGNHSFITREGHIDNTSIAEEEIKRKLLPVVIRRPLWSGASEYWLLEDLEYYR